MLTEKQIEKYQSLYKKHFGKEISKEKAQELGTRLVRLLGIIYRPITKEENKKYKKR